jgi:hydrogenase maturation factor
MCVGTIATLVEVIDQEGVRSGRLADGCIVPLTFVPEALSGSQLLLHLGIPVEVLDPEAARDALCLRAEAAAAAETVQGGNHP